MEEFRSIHNTISWLGQELRIPAATKKTSETLPRITWSMARKRPFGGLAADATKPGKVETRGLLETKNECSMLIRKNVVKTEANGAGTIEHLLRTYDMEPACRCLANVFQNICKVASPLKARDHRDAKSKKKWTLHGERVVQIQRSSSCVSSCAVCIPREDSRIQTQLESSSS